MIAQEFIDWSHYVRCICLGREEILPIKYDPGELKYFVEHDHMSEELGARVVHDARLLCRALGYDMNTMEFAVRDGIPYAIDFMNPAPDFDIYSLTPHYFEWVVQKMANLCIGLAKNGRPTGERYTWYRTLNQ